MTQFAKETLPISLEEEMRRSYLDYAMSVIVGRALPDARRAGEVFIAAQRSLRDSASPATWQMFAKLAATSAGWKLVFSGE